MATVLGTTVLPPADKSSSLESIVAALGRNGRAALIGPDGTRLILPDEVHQALREVVTAMANGQAITIAPHDTILTTQGAADLLGVSRPTLVRLLAEGHIPFNQPGRHRRVFLADLIAYQRRTSAHRRATLDEMAHDAAAHDSYDRVNGLVATR